MQPPSTPVPSVSTAAALASASTPSPPDAQAAPPTGVSLDDLSLSGSAAGPAAAPVAAPARPREIGGRDGPEPTRFGDWEKAGRCIDF